MCVIAVKSKAAVLDAAAWDRLFNCFLSNGDGAGFMYQDPGTGFVRIVKGCMEWKELVGEVEKHRVNRDGVEAVFHFRWATHGYLNRANTHPFPLSNRTKDLEALDVECETGIVHNGIITAPGMWSKELSDTQLFIRDYLAPLGKLLWNPNVLKLISATDSKFAIMDSKRGIKTIGSFISVDDWSFSNDSYKTCKKVWSGWKSKLGGESKEWWEEEYGDDYEGSVKRFYSGEDDEDDEEKEGESSQLVLLAECEETDLCVYTPCRCTELSEFMEEAEAMTYKGTLTL